jgi:hypothetical protein
VPSQTALFPDLKAVAIQVLLSANVNGTRIYSSLPDDVGTSSRPWPVIVIRRLGGLPVNDRWLDRANLQIEVWGTNQKECFDGFNASRKALFDSVGTTVNSCVITNARVILGPQDIPDPPTGRDRVVGGVALFGHPVS